MAHSPTAFSTFLYDPRQSRHKLSTPPSQFYDTAITEQPAFHTEIFSLQPELIDSVPNFSAHQLHGKNHLLMREYQGQHAEQVAAPWPDNTDPAMNIQSSRLPTEYRLASQDQFLYTDQGFALDCGQTEIATGISPQSNGLPVENHLASEAQLAYIDHNGVQDPDQLSAAPENSEASKGLLAAQPKLELKFAMTEPVELTVGLEEDLDAEGETDDDAEASVDNIAPAMSSSDPGYHSDNKAQEPQQKVYIRLSNLSKLMQDSPKKVKKDTNTRKSGRKRTRTRPFEELAHEHDEGRPRKNVKTDGNHADAEPDNSSPQLAPSTKLKSNRKRIAHQEARILSMKDHNVSSSPPPIFNLAPPPPHRFNATIPDYIAELFEGLSGQGHKVLPEIEGPNGLNIPWTAERLTLLYIHSYSENDIELCDLIADVWVRAFQERNRKKKLPEMWRPNTHHAERKVYNEWRIDGLPPVPRWQQKLALPSLSEDVVDFHPRLLNQLYFHTAASNGARMLWADAIALCGTSAEEFFIRARKNSIELHEDLCFNVMCTSLRMNRRHLTLKIEEVSEESWCQRYHMHSKWGEVCFRSKKDEKKAQALQPPPPASVYTRNGSGEMYNGEDNLDAAIIQGFEQAEDGYNAQKARPARHVQFALPQHYSAFESADESGDLSEEE